MLRKIAVCTALVALSACGGGSDDEETLDSAIQADAAARDAADNDEDASREGPTDAAATSDASTGMDAAGSSPEAGSEAGAAEAGSDGGLDAAPLDATVTDASADAGDTSLADTSTPDASTSAFTLTVRRGASQALPQVPVFFHAPDGALLSQHTTGSDGRVVSTTVPAMATVIVPKTGNVTEPIVAPQLYTFAELSAGDDLVLELPAEVSTPAPAPLPGYAVSVPTPLPANTSLVVAYGGALSCADKLVEQYTGPIALTWPQDCAVQSANTLLVTAYRQYSANDVRPVGYAFAKGVAAFGSAPHAITLGAWSAPVNTTVTLQNAPVGQKGEAKLLLYSEGASFDPTGLLVVPFPNTAATRSLMIPTPAGLATEQSALVQVGGPGTRQLSTLATRSAPAATQTLDMAVGIPGAASMTITTGARAVVSWTLSPSPTNPADGAVVYLEYPTQTVTPWLLLVPPGATMVKLPELPESRRGFLSAAPSMYLSRFASSKQGGYREFLKEPVRPTLDGFHALQRALPSETSLHAVSYSAP